MASAPGAEPRSGRAVSAGSIVGREFVANGGVALHHACAGDGAGLRASRAASRDAGRHGLKSC